MVRSLDFYFDFMSPFTYLALQRLPALAARSGYDVDYKVVDLGEIKRLAGNSGPSTRAIPIKLRYAKIDQQRFAKRYGVPIATPAHYDGSYLNRGSFFARARGQMHDYLMLAFHRVWGEGASMIDRAMLGEISTKLGWDADEFLQFTQSDGADAQYKASTLAAHQCGVFGVPTIVIDGEMWWGNDRLDFVEEFMAARSTIAPQAL